MSDCLCRPTRSTSFRAQVMSDCLCRPTRSTSFRAQVRGLICPKAGTVQTTQISFNSRIKDFSLSFDYKTPCDLIVNHCHAHIKLYLPNIYRYRVEKKYFKFQILLKVALNTMHWPSDFMQIHILFNNFNHRLP